MAELTIVAADPADVLPMAVPSPFDSLKIVVNGVPVDIDLFLPGHEPADFDPKAMVLGRLGRCVAWARPAATATMAMTS